MLSIPPPLPQLHPPVRLNSDDGAQSFPRQPSGPQSCCLARAQVPAPSQKDSGVARASEQNPGAQDFVTGGNVQASE